MKDFSQPEARSDADNWYGVLDPKERKKIQDRLAQRARRKRLAEEAKALAPSGLVIIRPRGRPPKRSGKDGKLSSTTGETRQELEERAQALRDMVEDIKFAQQHFRANHRFFLSPLGTDYDDSCRPKLLRQSPVFDDDGGGDSGASEDGGEDEGPLPDPFIPILEAISARSFPHPKEDPFFISIPAITIYAALWHNGLAMGIKCEPTPTRHISDKRQAKAGSVVPVDLKPTAMQTTTSHMTWIDRFPFAKFRDNMIKYTNTGLIDAEEFMRDVFLMKSFSLVPGGCSWRATDWRLGTEFGEKWGFVFI